MTLDFYDSDPEGYCEKTFGADMSAIRERFARHLDDGAEVLDLGCGSGRDSLAFTEQGFRVTAVDGSEGMCRAARKRTGLDVRHLLFSELDYMDRFDGVWACASLLHARSDELPAMMSLVRRALKDGGILFCCFKLGSFEGVRDGRWYTDMTESSLTELLEASGFEPLEVWTSEGDGTSWANSVSRRSRCSERPSSTLIFYERIVRSWHSTEGQA